MIGKIFCAFSGDWKTFWENKQDTADDKIEGKQNGWPKGQSKTGPFFLTILEGEKKKRRPGGRRSAWGDGNEARGGRR